MLEQLLILCAWLNENNFSKEASMISRLMNKKSMFIKGDPSNTGIIAYRENIWKVSIDEEIDESIRQEISDMLGLTKQSYWYNFQDLIEIVEEAERYDILIGSLSGKDLYLHTGTLAMDPKSSILVKKVTKELGLNSVYMSEVESDDEDKTSKYQMRGRVLDTAYHGTTTEYLGSILRVGIAPSREKSNYSRIDHPDVIFFSSRFGEAKHHANHTANKVGGDPVNLEFKIPNKDLIIPDYDVNVKSEDTGFYNYIPDDVREKSSQNSEMEGSSTSLSREFGIYGYKGRIPASFISSYYILMNSDQLYGTDSFYKSREEYTEATPEEARIYLETKEEFGYGSLELPEYEEEEWDHETEEESLAEQLQIENLTR